MDVSNHQEESGCHPAAGFLLSILPGSRLPNFGFLLLIVFAGMSAAPASAFTIARQGGAATVQLRPSDIAQDGVPLSAASEQLFDEGTLQASLTDFSQPIDVNVSGALSAGGNLTARIEATVAFRIRLSRPERNRCLQESDFDIDLNIVSPVPDALSATSAAGGSLSVLRFEPVYQGSQGNPRCPNSFRYGYTMDLSVADAVSAGSYEGIAEIVVDVPGPGGSTQTIQLPVRVDMPGMLLLYHYSQIDVNLDATALAGALGANRACSGGFCMDVGSRILPVSNLSGPIALNVAADAGMVDPVQTITLRDAIAVRATGCAGDRYDTASYQILNVVGGVQPASGVISGIQSAPCGLDLRSGDLSFDLDLTQADAVTGSASATIQITVTGL